MGCHSAEKVSVVTSPEKEEVAMPWKEEEEENEKEKSTRGIVLLPKLQLLPSPSKTELQSFKSFQDKGWHWSEQRVAGNIDLSESDFL